MCAVTHFFGEYIWRIKFARDMLESNRFVFDPLTDRVFTKLDVTCGFWGHVVWPLDTSIIIIVKKSRLCSIRKRMASFTHTGTEGAKVKNLFWGCISGAYFSFAGAERCLVLAIAEPAKRSAVPKDNATAHTPKLEKWKKGPVCNGTANLRSPASIDVGWKSWWDCRCRWDSVGISFSISQRRKVFVTMHRSHQSRSERYTVVMCRVDIVECIEGRLHMAKGWLVTVRWKKGVNGWEVKSCRMRRPSNTTNETLIGLFATNLSRQIVVIGRRSDGIDGNARPIWSSHRSRITWITKETFNQVGSKTLLVEMDDNISRGDLPRKVDTKKPFNNPQKIHVATFA
jgi:hypothetical protein